MRVLLFSIGFLGVATSALALSAPTHYVPFTETAQASKHSVLPEETISRWLAQDYPVLVYGSFAGQNADLAAAGSSTPLEIASGLDIALDSSEFLADPWQNGENWYWIAAIQSEDALAQRLRVDLSRLAMGERLWLLDPGAQTAHGPFTLSQQPGTWLPTISGDTAIVVLESDTPARPTVQFEALSHFFLAPLDAAQGAKGEVCPIPVACETDPEIANAATGVGLLIIAAGNRQFLCSGSLLNNANTVEFEPYLIGANHCFPGVNDASNVEVIWDFRAQDCAGNGVPALGGLPRSRGVAFLAINAQLDAQFLELDQVPVGPNGRAWLGWESGPVEVGDPAISIHHPAGGPQELNRGAINRLNVSSILGQNQVQVRWAEGVTQSGSSGSPALLTEGGLRVFGMLSNGVDQACDNPSPRLDQYASLEAFFPEIQFYLTGEGVPGAAGCAPSQGPAGREALAMGIGAALVLLAHGLWSRRHRNRPAPSP